MHERYPMLAAFLKILEWVLFAVLFSLVPFLFNYVILIYSPSSTPYDPSIFDLVRNGELFILSVTMSAATLGSLISSGKDYRSAKILVGFIALSIGFFAALFYGILSTSQILTNTNPSDDLIRLSLFFFLGSVSTQFTSLIMKEV